jgi:hypothetical protein
MQHCYEGCKQMAEYIHPLPESFVTEGLKLAEGARLFGKRFFDMTHDELIAAAAQGWNAERKARQQNAESSAARAAFFAEQARFWKGDRAA